MLRRVFERVAVDRRGRCDLALRAGAAMARTELTENAGKCEDGGLALGGGSAGTAGVRMRG
jgi:hypothetical protein